MNISEVLQKNEDAVFLVRTNDLKEFAIAAVEHYKNSAPAEPKEPAAPISQNDAAKILNRSRQTLVKWRKKGILKGFLIGGRIFFRPEDIASLQRIKLS